MNNIEPVILTELTTRKIIVSGTDIGEDAARALALELHSILAAIQQFYADRPRITADGRPEYEAVDLVLTVWLTALNYWPTDKDQEAGDSIWIADTLADAPDICERLPGEFRPGCPREALLGVERTR